MRECLKKYSDAHVDLIWFSLRCAETVGDRDMNPLSP